MIVKGIVSAIDSEAKTISVILPEYNNVVTRPIKVYQDKSFRSLKVNDFVLVVVFNNDFNDCLIVKDGIFEEDIKEILEKAIDSAYPVGVTCTLADTQNPNFLFGGSWKKLRYVNSKNLFDPASVVDGFVSSSGQYALSASGEKSFLVQCKPNTDYTLSKLQTSKLRILGCDSTPTNAMAGEILVNLNTQTNTTFNSGDNTYLVIFYLNNTGENYTNDEVVSSMMLEIGSTATEYVPYMKKEIAGYSVTESEGGKNLLSPAFEPSYTQYGGVTFTDNGNGTITVNGTALVTMWIEFFGKQAEGDSKHAVRKGSYVFNDFKNKTASTFRTALLAFTPNKELLRTFEHYNSSVLVDIPQDAHLTYQIRISQGTVFDNVILKPQLEIGTTATEYEPYYKPQTHSVDMWIRTS